jgi:hypothetical protein
MKRFAILLTALALATSAGAAPILIPNAGFEVRETFDPFAESVDKYNQWARETWRHFNLPDNGGPLRIWNPGVPGVDETTQGAIDVGFGGNAPEGKYVVLVRSRQNDPTRTFEAATQLLTETFDSTKTYTLSAKVGRPPGSPNYTPQWYGYSLQFAVGGTNIDGATYAGQVTGGTILAQDNNSLTVPVDGFVTSTVTYTPNPAHSVYDGQPIQIRLAALETPVNPGDDTLTGWVVFDDVTLDGSSAPTVTTITGTAGGNDNWNTAGNWDNGVPTGAIDAVVAAGVLAQVQNTATPSYSGSLTLEDNATLRILNAAGSQNSVTGASGITMNPGSKIQVNINANIPFPPIALAGDAALESLFGASDHQTDTFAAITGSHTLTISGFNNHTYTLTEANTFAELIANSIDRYTIRANAPGSLGAGDVYINKRTSDDRGPVLVVGADDAMADTATLYLTGRGWNDSGGGAWPGTHHALYMDANDTIAQLFVDGVDMGAGVFTAASGEWISGGGTLTVLGGGPPPPGPVPIDDLFNTGVDASGNPLPDGTIGDPHYTITSVPSGSTDIRVRTSSGGFPIGPWLPDNATSAWVGPNNAADLSSPEGDYTFQTSFTLDSLADLSSVTISGRWATDNPGVDILLNGNSLLGSGHITAAEVSTGFTAWTNFDFGPGVPFFSTGANTLGFVFNNLPTSNNPAGLRVDDLTGSYLLSPGGGGFTLPVVLPTGINWDFETNANQFTVWPGYVGGGNPAEITGWPGAGAGRGINPGSIGSAPFRNNGNNDTNVAFIQGAGSISQEIEGWEPGKEYRVTFDYNARTGTDPGLMATIGGASFSDAAIPETGGDNAYYVGNIVFTPTSGTNTLTFTSLDNPGDDTVLIDNIRVFRNGPTIADNGFENPVQPGTSGFDAFKQANGTGNGTLAGSAWTIIGGAGITRNVSAFQNGGIFAPEGEQHALIQAVGSFMQTITGFEVGAEYSFSLLTMARQAGAGGNDLEVLLDAGLPTEIPLIDYAEVIFTSFTEAESASFLAQKDSYELTIRSTLNDGLLTGDRTTFFDALWFNQLSTYIPEPATAALLGLSLLALARRRRRK